MLLIFMASWRSDGPVRRIFVIWGIGDENSVWSSATLLYCTVPYYTLATRSDLVRKPFILPEKRTSSHARLWELEKITVPTCSHPREDKKILSYCTVPTVRTEER